MKNPGSSAERSEARADPKWSAVSCRERQSLPLRQLPLPSLKSHYLSTLQLLLFALLDVQIPS